VALAYKTGEWVYRSDVSAAAGAVNGVFVREVMLARDDGTPADVLSVPIGAREKARFLTTGITVQVIEDAST